MNPQEPILLRSARWLAFGSAAAIMVGIAPSQILLALSFAALLACGEKLRLPRIWLPLGLFLLGTVVSLLLSDDPTAGLPQIRKFYVFLDVAGGVFAAAQSGDGPLPLPHLGGNRRTHRDSRVCPVRRQGAGGASPRAQLLRFLRRRADHRLHQPLEYLFRGRDVRADHAGVVSVLRAGGEEAPLGVDASAAR